MIIRVPKVPAMKEPKAAIPKAGPARPLRAIASSGELARVMLALKTVLAVNDQVLQWLMVRPQYGAFKDLKGKKIAVTGVAAVATFMLKKVAAKYGLDANNDLTFLALPPGQRLGALQAGAVDAGLLSSEERFAVLDQGMKEILYLGKEVKNSWGTIATNDQFIKDKPKVMHGFMRAVLKALRLVKQNREVAINAMMKFSELDRELAARTYDGMIGTFTTNVAIRLVNSLTDW